MSRGRPNSTDTFDARSAALDSMEKSLKTKLPARKKFIVIICALILFGANFRISAQTVQAERSEIFEQVWNTINEKYYDASFNGVDWKQIGKRYRERLRKVSDDTEFYALLDEMAGELRDSHTRVYSPAQREQRKNQKRTSIGISLSEIEKVVAVASVTPGSEAARSGIKPGMIVRSIGGVPVKKAFSEARRAVGASSSERATAMRVFSKLLAGEPGTFLKIGLQDAGGRRTEFVLKRTVFSSAPRVEARILPAGPAYLTFGRFDVSIENEITRALDKFTDAPALIIDLRGNAGGDGEMGLRLAGRFFDKNTAIARIVTRSGKPPVEGMPMTLETENKNGRVYSKPVAVLIDERTASTAELISNALQETARATVFGTVSCGCVLAFLDYKPLAGGGDMTLSEFGFVTPRNRRLEGRGVTPDRIIRPTLEDIRTGRDAALEEAVNHLSRIID